MNPRNRRPPAAPLSTLDGDKRLANADPCLGHEQLKRRSLGRQSHARNRPKRDRDDYCQDGHRHSPFVA